MDDDEAEGQDEGTESGAEGAATPASPSLAQPPASIRNSPEYRAMAAENRKLRRQAGEAQRAAAAAREQAEQERQAAEAREQAALEADLLTTLGEDGTAVWAEIAELSATDQRAAARRFAELIQQGRAQSAPPADGEGAPAPADAGGTQVPANTPPPPPRAGADGGAPLNAQPVDTTEDVIASLQANFDEVIKQVQTPSLRNRVTERIRSGAMINYLLGSYLKAGATPRTPRQG